VPKDIRIKTQNTQVCRNGEQKQKEEEEEEEGMRKGVINLPIYKTSTKHQQETKPTKTWLKIQGSKKEKVLQSFSLSEITISFFFSLSLSLSFFLLLGGL